MNPALLKMVNELAVFKAGPGASIETVIETQIKVLVDLKHYEPQDSQLTVDCNVFIKNSQTALSVLHMLKSYQEKVSL